MFLNDDELKALLGSNKQVDPYVEGNITSGAYELTLGKEYYTTNSQTDVKTSLIDGQQFTIEPGQFALLITEEYIKIPDDKLGFISIKAGVKFAGLINVSGFHVDPGFEGKLKFSVYNAGSRPVTLEAGQPLFPLWISNFNKPLKKAYKGTHIRQKNISTEDVSKIAGAVQSPAVLAKKMNGLKAQFTVWKIIYGFLLAAILGLSAIIVSIQLANKGDNKSVDSKSINNIETTQKAILVLLHKQDSLLNVQKRLVDKHSGVIKQLEASRSAQ